MHSFTMLLSWRDLLNMSLQLQVLLFTVFSLPSVFVG